MKYNLHLLLLLSGVLSFSCSTKERQESTEDMSDERDWAEMDSFHLLMAEAFHPYKDSANLEPAKQLANEMVLKASSLALTSIPETVDSLKVKSMLDRLMEDTKAFSLSVSSGKSDEEIGPALQALHESFHSIMEAWQAGDKHEHQQ